MREILTQLTVFVMNAGGLGILVFAFLDSSFLYLPFGIDLLVVVMAPRHAARVPYYAAMATAGTVAGILILGSLARKGGEEGLKRFGKEKHVNRVKKKIKENAGWALIGAAVMPPPFPFRVFAASAAALEYPRTKLMAVTAIGRFVRFSAVGILGIFFGQRILDVAKSDWFFYAMLGVIAVFVLGTAFSIYTWFKHSAPRRSS